MKFPRSIDHLVLPVTDLAIARNRLSALGFTVAPDAEHPFGTRNACVFLPDGTYLEPLSVVDRRRSTLAAKRGNVFTARDLAFRGRKHREGFSALVVASEDAGGDNERFREEGISGGEMLEFSRPVTLPDGSVSEASFRLAFAADERAPDFFLFACQRVNPLPADRGELEQHSNSVVGVAEVILSAQVPSDFEPLLGKVVGAGPEGAEDAAGIAVRTDRAVIRVAPDSDLEAEFALHPNGDASGLSGRAVIFRVTDLAVTEITLAANDVAFIRKGGRVLVSAAPGQGVLFGFEE